MTNLINSVQLNVVTYMSFQYKFRLSRLTLIFLDPDSLCNVLLRLQVEDIFHPITTTVLIFQSYFQTIEKDLRVCLIFILHSSYFP